MYITFPERHKISVSFQIRDLFFHKRNLQSASSIYTCTRTRNWQQTNPNFLPCKWNVSVISLQYIYPGIYSCMAHIPLALDIQPGWWVHSLKVGTSMRNNAWLFRHGVQVGFSGLWAESVGKLVAASAEANPTTYHWLTSVEYDVLSWEEKTEIHANLLGRTDLTGISVLACMTAKRFMTKAIGSGL